ncbi:MAG: hypothetical protein ACRDWD_00735 [Acidimicrobiia bacterium]
MIDELADVPPEEFIAARDALAARLKAEGNKDEAAEVKKLRKPTVAQWLTDQMRRHHEDKIDALRAALREVGEAQEAAVTGGDRAALQDATAKRRDATAALGRAVDEVLARSERPAQYRDVVSSEIETAVSAEVAAGPLGMREDLELPDRPKPEPRRDLAAERRANAAKVAIEAAEARVQHARDQLEQARSELETVRDRYREKTDSS